MSKKEIAVGDVVQYQDGVCLVVSKITETISGETHIWYYFIYKNDILVTTSDNLKPM